MKKLVVLIKKDILLLIRDRAGLLFLFIMPMVLVLIMTGMQEGVVENVVNKKISLLVVNEDNDTIGMSIVEELLRCEMFDVTIKDNMTSSDLEHDIKKGNHLMGLFIPSNTTNSIQNNIKKSVAAAFSGLPLSVLESKMDSVSMIVYLDPTISDAFRMTMMSYLRESSLKLQNSYAFKQISDEVNYRFMLSMGKFEMPNSSNSIGILEIVAGEKKSQAKITAADHNIPAWTLFAIFFIVISLSGNIIKERQDGSFYRLMAMPCSYSLYLSSKVVVYLFVCILQFLLILSMGLWLFPQIGLSVFNLSGNLLICFLIVFLSALAAISFGLLISTFASTHQQAAIFGSISVVILSAIGGIWVPTFLMPSLLGKLSHASPLNWGLEAFYDIILRKESIIEILPEGAALLGFALLGFLICGFAKKDLR